MVSYGMPILEESPLNYKDQVDIKGIEKKVEMGWWKLKKYFESNENV